MSRFTPHEVETAIRVAMESKQVKKWVKGQARFLGVDLDTPDGKVFYERESRAAAKRLLA